MLQLGVCIVTVIRFELTTASFSFAFLALACAACRKKGIFCTVYGVVKFLGGRRDGTPHALDRMTL